MPITNSIFKFNTTQYLVFYSTPFISKSFFFQLICYLIFLFQFIIPRVFHLNEFNTSSSSTYQNHGHNCKLFKDIDRRGVLEIHLFYFYLIFHLHNSKLRKELAFTQYPRIHIFLD